MTVRKKIIPLAHGNVLEVGMGSGINLPLYNTDRVSKVWGIEPSTKMRELAQTNISNTQFPVEWLTFSEESIALADESVDTVVLCFTLCTIPDWKRSLNEINRVLKGGGNLLFCEHGSSPDNNVRKWQNRINPFWRPVAGGCNLNRPIDELIKEAEFNITWCKTEYMLKTPKIAGYTYWGQAKK